MLSGPNSTVKTLTSPPRRLNEIRVARVPGSENGAAGATITPWSG